MRTLLTTAGTLAMVWMFTGCGAPQPAAKKDQSANAARVAVRTAEVREEPWEETYEATGSLRARAVTAVSARLMSYITAVPVQEGDRVQEGQTLAVLDPRDQDAAARRAGAMKEEVASGIAEADAGAAAAKAQVELAAATHRRMASLHAKRSLSDQELDESTARLRAAQSAYEAAQSRQKQLAARMVQADQEIQLSTLQRGYTTVAAPFAGVIVSRTAEPGMLAMPGSPLFTIERASGFRLEANVEEARLGMIRRGAEVEVRIGDGPETVSGRVGEIVPAIDPASRSGIVKIDLPAIPAPRSGAFGRALFRLPGETRRVLTIPNEAVSEHGQLQSVFTAENGAARLRLIALGKQLAGRREVLSGLTAGERVLLPPFTGVSDGVLVEVRP
ncbi:MAG TPA: efflux RND transporter periplasmic adaptor subunit [Bryobacteraceae bacterium]|nr:efflux RND transporter periplasmic adaptor subunit [Bryobacteraceae bacterium]